MCQFINVSYTLHSLDVRYTLHIHERMGMNLKEQIEEIKEFIVNFSIDINTDDVPAFVSVDLGDQHR